MDKLTFKKDGLFEYFLRNYALLKDFSELDSCNLVKNVFGGLLLIFIILFFVPMVLYPMVNLVLIFIVAIQTGIAVPIVQSDVPLLSIGFIEVFTIAIMLFGTSVKKFFNVKEKFDDSNLKKYIGSKLNKYCIKVEFK